MSSLKKQKKRFFLLSRAKDREKILEPHLKSHLKPSNSALRCSTTELQKLYGEQGPLRSSSIIRVPQTAQIRNVVSLMFCKQQKKDGNILGSVKTQGNMCFRLVTSLRQRKSLSPHEDPTSNLALRCSATEPQRLYDGQGPLQTSYMTRVLYIASKR